MDSPDNINNDEAQDISPDQAIQTHQIMLGESKGQVSEKSQPSPLHHSSILVERMVLTSLLTKFRKVKDITDHDPKRLISINDSSAHVPAVELCQTLLNQLKIALYKGIFSLEDIICGKKTINIEAFLSAWPEMKTTFRQAIAQLLFNPESLSQVAFRFINLVCKINNRLSYLSSFREANLMKLPLKIAFHIREDIEEIIFNYCIFSQAPGYNHRAFEIRQDLLRLMRYDFDLSLLNNNKGIDIHDLNLFTLPYSINRYLINCTPTNMFLTLNVVIPFIRDGYDFSATRLIKDQLISKDNFIIGELLRLHEWQRAIDKKIIDILNDCTSHEIAIILRHSFILNFYKSYSSFFDGLFKKLITLSRPSTDTLLMNDPNIQATIYNLACTAQNHGHFSFLQVVLEELSIPLSHLAKDLQITLKPNQLFGVFESYERTDSTTYYWLYEALCYANDYLTMLNGNHGFTMNEKLMLLQQTYANISNPSLRQLIFTNHARCIKDLEVSLLSNSAMTNEQFSSDEAYLQEFKSIIKLWDQYVSLCKHLHQPVTNDNISLPHARKNPFYGQGFFDKVNLSLNDFLKTREIGLPIKNKFALSTKFERHHRPS